MSELTVQQGIQTVLQGMTEFANADVVINDWGILDASTSAAPYVLITNADEFRARQDVSTAKTLWFERVILFEAFDDWSTVMNNFRARRQAILDEFNAVGTARSLGTDDTTVDAIRSGGPIQPWYDPYLAAEDLQSATPLFIFQELLFEVTEGLN